MSTADQQRLEGSKSKTMVDFIRGVTTEVSDKRSLQIILRLLDSRDEIEANLEMIDPLPHPDSDPKMICASVRTSIGGLVEHMLENVWDLSQYPDEPGFRMRVVRWCISELLDGHEITSDSGIGLTSFDIRKIAEGFNKLNPFQRGAVAASHLKSNEAEASPYIRFENEHIDVPSESEFLQHIYDEIIRGNGLSEEEKEYFRLLLVDPVTDPKITIAREEDLVLEHMISDKGLTDRRIDLRVRNLIRRLMHWGLIATRSKAVTNEGIDQVSKGIILALRGGKGKKLDSVEIHSAALLEIKLNFLARSNPLFAIALNRAIEDKIEEIEEMTKRKE